MKEITWEGIGVDGIDRIGGKIQDKDGGQQRQLSFFH